MQSGDGCQWQAEAIALELRPAVATDHQVLGAIAAEGGSPDGDDRYFEFVASTGRLVVACSDGTVVGFGGAVPLPGAVMVSDLFVHPAARASGVGRSLLHDLLDGVSARTTFSSTHPAALRLYESFGMAPRGRLLTLAGAGRGGAAPLTPAPWRHGREDLVEHFRGGGALVTEDVVVHVGGDTVDVLRVDSDEPRGAIAGIVAAAASGQPVVLSVLESHPMVAWLLQDGFTVIDDDVWCASAEVAGTAIVDCVHRGLC